MTKDRVEHINEKFDLYRTMPEGQRISQILDKIPRRCSAWMTGEANSENSWFFLKKELLVQIMEKGFGDDEDTEPYNSLEETH